MLSNEFSFLEAANLVGERYETVTDFLVFPAGLRGRVVDFTFDPPHQLVLEWESADKHPAFGSLLFSKAMVERYLERIEPQNVGENADFTVSEASALVGKVFQTRVNFSRIPKSSQGAIIDFARQRNGSAVIIVEWTMPNSAQPSLSWFTKTQIQRYGIISP